jgi:glycosyltransferase involved in cell wall biosynthesis
MRTVLVLYGLLQHPLRSTVEDHLYSLRRYSQAHVFYANLVLAPMPRWMRRIRYDAIVFHTSLLSSLRWAPQVDQTLRERVLELGDLPGVRAAMPQDEFLRNDALCDFIRDAGVDVVFSVSPESEWPKIYAGVDRERVRFESVLTGYLDERTLERIDKIVGATRERPNDLFYRAGAERPYLGRHGMLKTQIAVRGQAEGHSRGLSGDISIDPADTLLGDDWFRHLAAARWTLGVEGGASILDRDGAVRDATMRYVAAHPDASYDEIEAACFPGRDGELALFALSPRHLEACATRTGQILVEGSYSGVLEPGRHYLELKSDLSNMGAVLDEARDERRRQEMVEAAHRDVVASDRYTYRGFASAVDGALLSGPARSRTVPARLAVRAAAVAGHLQDRLSWARVAWRVRFVGKLKRRFPRLRWLLGAIRGRRRPLRSGGQRTVVSVTPLRLEADSRTLKEAVSLARTGMRSIVVERFASAESWDDVPIEVVSLGPAPAPATASPKPKGRAKIGYYLVRPVLPIIGPILGYAMLTRATLNALPAADLYWVHSVPHLPAVALRARQLGVPFIYDAHDFYADAKHNPWNTWRTRWSIFINDTIERVGVRLAADCVTVGAGIAELQVERFRRPFTVLHNAHDHRLDRAGPEGIRETLGLGDDKFLLVASGNSKEGTAFEEAFDALAALPEHVHLAFVGRSYDGTIELARERGVGERVHFLPPVPPTEVTTFIRSADAAAILYFPLTSNFLNALPNRLYQAIAAGLPLLYPETMQAISAICEEHGVGLPMDTRDAGSVEAAIRAVVDDPAELERLRANAARAARVVNWEHEEAKLNTMLAALLNGRPT